MRFVSYNIHRAVGAHGRPSIRAVGEVLRALQPDVVALNEIVRAPFVADQPARLGSMLRMSQAFHRTTRSYGTPFGNAVLVRGRILDVQHVALPAPGAEPRGVLFVDAEVDGEWFTIGCTHLEPRPRVREGQLEVLARLLRDVRGCGLLGMLETRNAGTSVADAAFPETPPTTVSMVSDDGCPLVVAGDLNAAPDELASLLEDARLSLAPPHPTFPATRPLAAIDHVMFSRHWRVTDSFTVAAPVSDHVALVVDLELLG